MEFEFVIWYDKGIDKRREKSRNSISEDVSPQSWHFYHAHTTLNFLSPSPSSKHFSLTLKVTPSESLLISPRSSILILAQESLIKFCWEVKPYPTLLLVSPRSDFRSLFLTNRTLLLFDFLYCNCCKLWGKHYTNPF